MKNTLYKIEKLKRGFRRVISKLQKKDILSDEEAKILAMFTKKMYKELEDMESEINELEITLHLKEKK